MQHYIFPAPIPAPLPPPPGGRGTILSQEARLHALQISEEIQAERGSYRKWNEVAKVVNREYGSNVDGDLVKRQVTSMLRSVQRSGLNAVKRPRKHAEVIQQLLDPVAVTPKRQCITDVLSPSGVSPLRIRAAGEEGDDGEPRPVIVGELGEDDHGSNTGSESGSPVVTPAITDAPLNAEKTDTTGPTTTTATTSTTTTTTTTTSSDSVGEPSTSTSTTPTKLVSESIASVLNSTTKPEIRKSGTLDGESHSIERVPRKKSEKHTMHLQLPLMTHHNAPLVQYPPPPRILPNMTVDDVYSLITRIHPDIDAEFVKTQEIDGAAFQTLSHKELTDFGVTTFGKRNKLLQLIAFDTPAVPPQANPPDFYFGRLPAFSSGSAFVDSKGEGDKHDKESNAEKKPPVTKVLDMEVVGVRKRYLVERENGVVEVLTPCKLRKYKHLTSVYEHIHPDKLVPISSFSTSFTHVPGHNNSSTPNNNNNPSAPSSSSDDPSKPADPSTSSSSATSPAAPPAASRASKSKKGKTPNSSFMAPTAAYYPVYYSGLPSPYPVMGSSSGTPGNLQWVPSPYPGVSSQRTPEKYHSFHPYRPPHS